MDRIALHRIRAYGRHGADPGEREEIQPFEIDLAAEVNLRRASESDRLADTIDYAALHARLVQIVADTSYALLERLAAELLGAVFEDHRIVRAEITVAKPAILDGATPSVMLERVNPNYEQQ